MRRVAVAAAVFVVACLSARVQAQRPVLIFAASSLQTAFDALTPAMAKAAGVPVRVAYAASSALARQIENGAPADVFVSADLDWMDAVAAHGGLQPATRRNLLGNALVLVAPAKTPVTLPLARGVELAERLGTGRLAVANPDTVPAGKYAKQALTALGLWPSVASRLAPAENVRAALFFVSRGEAPLGIVYRTDALADAGVMIAGTFPGTAHAPIVYPVALTRAASAAAAKALAFLFTAEARAVFTRLGFSEPPPDSGATARR